MFVAYLKSKIQDGLFLNAQTGDPGKGRSRDYDDTMVIQNKPVLYVSEPGRTHWYILV